MKPAVLFVDDEANILQGLRRMLRGMRSEWDMDFAEGGEAALAKLSEKHVDVLVTDMKMPGVNGAELLDQVAALYPRTIRLILSGEADIEATYRTIKTSHQFLPKPSNSERLAEIITACLNSRNHVAEEKLQTLVTALGNLPVSTATETALARLLDEESASIDEAAEIFAAEPALAAKMMQLANSAYFGIGDPVNNPKAATNLLGWDVLRTLLLKHDLAPACPAGPNKAIYERSVVKAQDTAELAAWIAAQEGGTPADIAYAQLAGLLHELGRLLLCATAPEDYAKVPALVTNGQMIDEAEGEVFGSSHTALGAYLAQIWGLPGTVIEAIRLAQKPSDLADSQQQQIPLLAVHAAMGILAGMRSSDPTTVATTQLDSEFLARQNCGDKVSTWVDGWAKRENAA